MNTQSGRNLANLTKQDMSKSRPAHHGSSYDSALNRSLPFPSRDVSSARWDRTYAYKLTCFIIVDTIVTTVHQNYQLYCDSGNAPNHFSAGIVSLGSKKMFVMNDDSNGSEIGYQLRDRWSKFNSCQTRVVFGFFQCNGPTHIWDNHTQPTTILERHCLFKYTTRSQHACSLVSLYTQLASY